MLTSHDDRPHRDAGFSLIELLVVIMLLGFVGAVFVSGITTAFRRTREVQDRTYTRADLQKAVERIARELRVADPVESATADSVQVRVFGANCTRYRYVREGTTLRQYRLTPLTPTPPAAGVAAAAGAPAPCTSPEPSPILASGASDMLTNIASSGVLFTYYDEAGLCMPFPGNSCPVVANPPPADLDNIWSIEISLSRVAVGKPTIRVSTRVDLRNAR